VITLREILLRESTSLKTIFSDGLHTFTYILNHQSESGGTELSFEKARDDILFVFQISGREP